MSKTVQIITKRPDLLISDILLPAHRKLLTECCDPRRMFAVTKENSPMGKVLWYDGEFYHSHTVNNDTYPLFVQVRGDERGLIVKSDEMAPPTTDVAVDRPSV